jgi:hypothetical protein
MRRRSALHRHASLPQDLQSTCNGKQEPFAPEFQGQNEWVGAR